MEAPVGVVRRQTPSCIPEKCGTYLAGESPPNIGLHPTKARDVSAASGCLARAFAGEAGRYTDPHMSRLARLIGLIVAGLTVWTVPARGQQTVAVAGCYVFTRPYFTWHEIEASSFTTFAAQTPLVQLLDEPAAYLGPQQNGRRLIVPGLRDSSEKVEWYRYSRWISVPPDSIALSWWNGLFGTHLSLRVFPDSLVGTSSYASDVGDPNAPRSHTARQALARRVPCPSP